MVLKASRRVDFGDGAGLDPTGKIAIEPESYYFSADDFYHHVFRVYCKNKVVMRASDGDFTYLGHYIDDIPREGLSFTGTDSIALNYYADRVTITPIGDFFDINMKRIIPRFQFDKDKQIITVQEPMYGMARALYSTPYTRYGYKYRVETDPHNQRDVFLGVTYHNGTILALDKTTRNVATYDIPDYASQMPQGDSDGTELWRVTSNAVVTENDVYELHKDHAKEISFIPGSYFGFRMQVKRTHEVMYVDPMGRPKLYTYNIPLAKPFDGGITENGDYPIKSIQYASESSIPADIWAEAYRMIEQRKAKAKEEGLS